MRYYISNRMISGGTDPRGWRLPAPQLELAVACIIARHIGDLAKTHRLCAAPDLDAGERVRTQARHLIEQLSAETPDLMARLLAEGRLAKGHITLSLVAAVLAEGLGMKPEDNDPAALQIAARFELRRRGVEGKVISGDHEPAPDRTLLRALAQAHAWTAGLRSGKPLGTIAAATGHSESYLRTRAQLAILSPTIQRAIIEGRQPPELTLEQIVRKPVPLDWDLQERMYGFDQHRNQP